MAKSFSELESKIPDIVKTHTNILVRSSRMNRAFEKYVLGLITHILGELNQTHFVEMLYTITKELTINGIKANQKRVFFEDLGLDITNEEEYDRGIKEYAKKFSEKMADEYGKRCLARGVYIQLRFQYSREGLLVEVTNNTPVIKTEEIRMREKMKKSMGYNDIAEFYMDNMDNTEGAGLGIALIMILMKNEGVDPNLFRIKTHADRTVARVEVPFSDSYISIRSAELAEI